MNISIDIAMNGKEAVEQVYKSHQENKYYTLIIMDLNMPVMNGEQATKVLRKMHEENDIDLSRTKIYIHSAIQKTLIGDVESIFDGQLAKPVNVQQLKQLIEKFNIY